MTFIERYSHFVMRARWMELTLLNTKNIYVTKRLLEPYKNKIVTVEGRVSGGLDFHSYNFGLVIDSVKDIIVR